MKLILQKLFKGNSITADESFQAMKHLMSGEVSEEQIAGFLGALAGKKPEADEILGLVRGMREHSLKISPDRNDLVDTCGTGGSGLDTFNVSTTSAFILAAAGLAVVKHGNRAASSKCGTADVLEELGINIESSLEKVTDCVQKTGFGFLFARTFHPAMRYVAPVRSALGVKTVFNILGPLTNPANAQKQVIGVYDPEVMVLMAEVLRELGSKEVLLVHGLDGMDEITLSTETKAVHLKNGQINKFNISPKEVGLPQYSLEELLGNNAKENANVLLGILKGEKSPKRDLVVVNSGAALWITGKASNLEGGCRLAESLLDSGKAYQNFQEVKNF